MTPAPAAARTQQTDRLEPFLAQPKAPTPKFKPLTLFNNDTQSRGRPFSVPVFPSASIAFPKLTRCVDSDAILIDLSASRSTLATQLMTLDVGRVADAREGPLSVLLHKYSQ